MCVECVNNVPVASLRRVDRRGPPLDYQIIIFFLEEEEGVFQRVLIARNRVSARHHQLVFIFNFLTFFFGCWVPFFSCWAFRSFSGLLGFTGFYWVSVVVQVLHGVLLGFTGFYWVSVVVQVLHGVLLGFTGFYWVLLGFTGFH